MLTAQVFGRRANVGCFIFDRFEYDFAGRAVQQRVVICVVRADELAVEDLIAMMAAMVSGCRPGVGYFFFNGVENRGTDKAIL